MAALSTALKETVQIFQVLNVNRHIILEWSTLQAERQRVFFSLGAVCRWQLIYDINLCYCKSCLYHPPLTHLHSHIHAWHTNHIDPPLETLCCFSPSWSKCACELSGNDAKLSHILFRKSRYITVVRSLFFPPHKHPKVSKPAIGAVYFTQINLINV